FAQLVLGEQRNPLDISEPAQITRTKAGGRVFFAVERHLVVGQLDQLLQGDKLCRAQLRATPPASLADGRASIEQAPLTVGKQRGCERFEKCLRHVGRFPRRNRCVSPTLYVLTRLDM